MLAFVVDTVAMARPEEDAMAKTQAIKGIDFSGTASGINVERESVRRSRRLDGNGSWRMRLLATREGRRVAPRTLRTVRVVVTFNLDDYLSIPMSDAERSQSIRELIVAELRKNWRHYSFLLVDENKAPKLLEINGPSRYFDLR